MSSLVHKKRQQMVGAAATVAEEKKGPATQPPQKHQRSSDNNAACPTAEKSSIFKKGLQRRSVSFEKLMVTACHIRLVCSCSREALKLCLELLILRSRIMAQQLIAAVLTNLLHLSHKHKFLDPVSAVLPKWQNRATMMQRQWRRDMEIRTITTTTESQEATNNNRDTSPAVENAHKNETMGRCAEKETDVKLIDNSPTLMDKNGVLREETEEEVAAAAAEQGYAEKRYVRQRLTLAVTGCAILLGLQVILGFALLLQTIHKTPWELYFLCGCVFYIGYLVQSIFNYDLSTQTTCNFGGANKTPPRSPTKIVKKYDAIERRGIDGEVGRVIHLSFIERTMSKVKLL